MTLVEEDLVPKYDNDGDQVAYEESEVIEHDHGEFLVMQRIMNVAVSQSIDSDSCLRNNILHTKCTAKGKVCSMIIDNGSCENVVSTHMVQKLGLKEEDHLEPYQLTWL